MNLRERASPRPVPSTFFSAVPTCLNSSKQRDREGRACPRLEHGTSDPALVGTLGRDVRDLDRLARDSHLPDGTLAPAQARCAQQRGLAFVGIERRARRELLSALVVFEDRAGVCARELHGTADNRRKDGVEVERRADCSPDVAQGCERRRVRPATMPRAQTPRRTR